MPDATSISRKMPQAVPMNIVLWHCPACEKRREFWLWRCKTCWTEIVPENRRLQRTIKSIQSTFRKYDDNTDNINDRVKHNLKDWDKLQKCLTAAKSKWPSSKNPLTPSFDQHQAALPKWRKEIEVRWEMRKQVPPRVDDWVGKHNSSRRRQALFANLEK